MIHGGDIYTYQKGNEPLIDYSSNINPIPLEESFFSFLKEGRDVLHMYPDIAYRSLKESLSIYLKAPRGTILVGNGAMELIDAVISEFQSVLLFQPSFVEYQMRSEIHNLEITTIYGDETFHFNLKDFLNSLKQNQLVILGNPNNPTGYRLKKEDLLEIYRGIQEKNGFLVLDEAFFEFCPDDYDSINLFGDDFSHVMIVRAATKFYRAPGIRLGYAVTNQKMVEKIERKLLPWSVNSFADYFGRKISELKDYKEKSQTYFHDERERLFSELNHISNLKYYPTEANYILLKFEKLSGDEVFDFLLNENILVRKCKNYDGLDSSFIRVAIKSREENNYLLQSLKKLEVKRYV